MDYKKDVSVANGVINFCGKFGGTMYSENRIHVFQAKDSSHDRNSEIQAMLGKLRGGMKEAGYVPDTNLSLFDLEDEEKASEVWYHSEKMALAFGLIALPQGRVPMRITKNLRICGDCHSAIKFISRIVGREIFVRHNHHFHCFKDGCYIYCEKLFLYLFHTCLKRYSKTKKNRTKGKKKKVCSTPFFIILFCTIFLS